MPNRENHKTDEFEVVGTDRDGEEFAETVFEYQEVMERRAVNKPSEWIKMGPRWFRLGDGTPVNQIDDNTFEVATTGIRLTRAR
jgi:hypothetical protein